MDTKVVENCLKQSCRNKDWASTNVDTKILGKASNGEYTGFQTILHMIPTALRSSWGSAGSDPDRNARTESFVCLFRWLMKTFPLLYSEKRDYSSSDFLQGAIEHATPKASSASVSKSRVPIDLMKKKQEAAQEVLKVFVCEFPKQAAKLLQVGPALQDRESARKVHRLLSLVERFGEIEPLFEAFDVHTILATDDNGDTALHRAATFGTLPEHSAERALGVVKCLVKKCPKALEVVNERGLSPYQTRAERLVQCNDIVAKFLKTQYIRYPPEEATRLLYGVEGGIYSASQSSIFLALMFAQAVSSV